MKVILQNLALFAVYVATAAFGLQLDAVSGFASLVWAPTGIALAALFLYGRRLWPGVFLAALAINLYTGASPLVAAGIAVGNTLEALIASELLRRAGFRPRMDRMMDALALFSLAAVLSPLVSATIGVTSLWLGGLVAPGAYGVTWRAWWVGDMLGALIVAPPLLHLLGERVAIRLRRWRLAEAVALAAALVGVSWVVFGDLLGTGSSAPPIMYVVFMPIVWAATRFAVPGTVLATFVLACLAVWGTVLGHGPFVHGSLSESLLYLQGFMGSVAVSALFLASAIAERRRAETDASRLNEELKKKAMELEEEERRDRALLSAIGEGVVAVDQKGAVMAMNRAAESMLGLRFKEVAGKSFVRHVPMVDADGEPVPTERRPATAALKTAETVRSPAVPPYYYVRKDGTKFPVALTASPIVMDFVRGAVLVFREISRETALDQAKTEFISIASHQLRDPISIVRWNLERLTAVSGTLDAESQDALREVDRGAALLARLVDDLLDVSRIDAGTFKPVVEKTDLDAVTRDVMDELRLAAEKKDVAFRIRRERGVPSLLGDPRYLRLMIQNLLSNAVKYAREGTTVTVGLDLVRPGESHAGRKPKRDVVIVSVADKGIGIPARQHDKIFTKFFRADNVLLADTVGTGLGLYLTKAVANRMGGDVWFESQEGRGSTFYLMLPTEPNGKA